MTLVIPSGWRGARSWRAAAAAAAAAVAAFPPSAHADWPVYGHDLANTRSAGRGGPGSAEARVLRQEWAFSSPTGDFTGTPVVAGGVLVAGDNGGTVYGLDAVTGRRLWSRAMGAPVNGSAAIDLRAAGGASAFVPVADPDRPRVVALALRTGRPRWSATLTRQAGSTVFGSPTFWRGAVYIGTSGPNGDQSTARGSVVALSERNGRVRWRTYTVPARRDGGAVWSTPAIDGATGRLYVGTGNAYHAPAAATTDAVLALDARSGRIVGHFQATAGDTFAGQENPLGPDADFGASANLIRAVDGRPLVGEGAKDGVYWALDRRTLRRVWRTSVGPGSAIGGILGSTAYDGSRIYGTDAVNGGVWALGRDGATRWSSQDSGSADFSPVATGAGILYTVAPGGSLVARDAATGAVLSRTSLGATSFGGASVAGHAVYVAVGTGPPPAPAPGSDPQGSIVALGDTWGGPFPEFRLRFTTRRRGRRAGARLHGWVHRSPNQPGVKPAALRTEVLDLPPGARFDGRAAPACRASDADLQDSGRAACPPASRVGAGRLLVMTGAPSDPSEADVTVFNTGRGTVELITAPGTNATLAIDRGNFTRPNELTNHPPSSPGGPPDFKVAVSQIDLDYNPRFLVTPRRCPRSGAWTSQIRYSTSDGRTYRRASRSPCRHGP